MNSWVYEKAEEYSEGWFTEITPRLWQGGTRDSDMIDSSRYSSPASEREEFTAIVSLDFRSQPVGPGVKEYRYGFVDGPISLANIKHILEIADWAYEQWQIGEKVLIRCQAGANRSGLITALVLMKDGLSADEAIKLIQSKRSFALSNSDFNDWLRKI